MVLDADGEAFFRRVETRPARHRPAFQDAIELQAEIEVKPPRPMFLDDIESSRWGFGRRSGGALRLARAAEIALGAIGLERHAPRRLVGLHDRFTSAHRHARFFAGLVLPDRPVDFERPEPRGSEAFFAPPRPRSVGGLPQRRPGRRSS